MWFQVENEEEEPILSLSDDVVISLVKCEDEYYIRCSYKKPEQCKDEIKECIRRFRKLSHPAIASYVKHVYNGADKPFHIYFKNVKKCSNIRSYNVYNYSLYNKNRSL